MNNDKKVFAFKLAEKKKEEKKAVTAKWQAREGVALAGCSDPTGDGDYRYPKTTGGTDNGVWC